MTVSLWRHADFLKLWVGQTISELGSVVTRTAMPLVALLVLGGGPFEFALLIISESLAVLLVSLVAGAWVDRLRRRPLLIAADVLRGVLLLSVPIAYALNGLRMEQLYVVLFLVSAVGAVFSTAYPAYVPTLVGVDRVVDANAKLATSSSIAEIGGPGLAGALVQLFKAPFAILVDAVSFFISAVSLFLIRTPEPARPPRDVDSAVRSEIVEGLRAVREHRVLWPMAVRSIVAHVAGSFYGVLYTIYLVQDLHLNTFLFGIVISAGGVGSIVGSLFASRVIRRLGLGPALIWTAIGASILGILTPLAQGPLPLAFAMLFIPQLIGDGLQTIEGVAETSLIQGLVPNHILGRVNATLETVSHGIAYPIGALAAAALAGVIGARGGIAIGWFGMAVSIAILVLSPLPRVRHAADYTTEPRAGEAPPPSA
ncbi:MAG TPA: MFS transporter [Candidatus Limnocylindrales bacterium]|jgi:MFS family permease|nr:MFS transporter [Candidatus Limnocylindrales bacterium]